MAYYSNRNYNRGYARSLNSAISQSLDGYVIEAAGEYYFAKDWDEAEECICYWLSAIYKRKLTRADLDRVINDQDRHVAVAPCKVATPYKYSETDYYRK